MVLYLSLFNCFLLKTKKQTKEDVKKKILWVKLVLLYVVREMGHPLLRVFFRAHTRVLYCLYLVLMLYCITTHHDSKLGVLCALQFGLKSRNRTGQAGTCCQRDGTTCGILAC